MYKVIKSTPACQVVRFILTLTTWWIALFQHMATAKMTRGYYKTQVLWKRREKKLSVMGNEGLWKTFRTFFSWDDSNCIVFSTVNPYLIAGRTKWSEGSRVITRVSGTWPRAASGDKLLCRGFWFGPKRVSVVFLVVEFLFLFVMYYQSVDYISDSLIDVNFFRGC